MRHRILHPGRMNRAFVTTIAFLVCTAAARAADRPAAMPTIPDVGEPFDVKSAISVPFSYRNNAFTSYRHASRSYVAPQNAVTKTHQPGVPINWDSYFKSLNEAYGQGWAHANADVRRWLEANEFALEIWHRGTECADAMDRPPADIRVTSGFHPEMREFARLAWLEAARLTGQGKPADAWNWHRAALRSSVHVPRHTQIIGPLMGLTIYADTADIVRRWSARADLSASDLRRALADVIAVNEIMPRASDALKGNYLVWSTKESRLAAIEAAVPPFAPLIEQLGYEERAHRTLNLVYANLLSQADCPPFRRTAVRGALDLFGRGPAAPVDAKVYSDEEIEGKILAFPPDLQIARRFLPLTNIWDFFDRGRVMQAALVLSLALELHYREHGEFPKTLAELVRDGDVKSIPPDPYGQGEPFHYRRENDRGHGAVLWSVWLDGVDQQGKLDAQNPSADGKGDRIFKIDAPR